MKRVFMYIIALILLTAVLPKQPACAEALPLSSNSFTSTSVRMSASGTASFSAAVRYPCNISVSSCTLQKQENGHWVFASSLTPPPGKIICTEDGFLRVVNSEDIRSYYVTPFQNQEAYVWYASANRMCLPSKNITNYNYYQNMLRVLAYFCKNQMSIDSAQALITALFAEVIHCE